MRSFYFVSRIAGSLLLSICFIVGFGQDCTTLNATWQTTASRCTATGTINITASGGSGNYNYKASGPVATSFTSANLITGLPPGTYTITVKDVVSGCSVDKANVVIGGNYSDPRFQLNFTDVTCINGTNGTITVANLQNGLAPFRYTIVAPSPMGVGTFNSTGTFTNLIPGDYSVQLQDSCGGIQTRRVTIQNYNWWIDQAIATKPHCDSVLVNISLLDNKGNNNLSGTTFNGYQYGIVRASGDTVWSSSRSVRAYINNQRNLTFVVKDNCGNKKTATWTQPNPPTVAGTVSISNRTCSNFTATITGQANLTNPQYCLYTSANALVACNATGVFNNVSYGSYCIRITDNCYDTTISRCFTENQPTPSVASNVTLSNQTCTSFTATITGQTNLISPTYCIYNSANVQLACNSTGVFNNLAYGNYCIRITDGCTGTVINRCFTATRPVPNVGSIGTSNLGCTTFTATLGGGTNLTNPTDCLYNASNVLVTCNSTGVFSGLTYGTYCIRMTNTCYDTTITRCITVSRPVPSVANNVTITNKTCTKFDATITGQTNLTNPQYCLYDAGNNLVSCNNNGNFNNLTYGSYCIRITNSATCYDTVITRCFTALRPVPSVGASVSITNRSCTKFSASVTGQTNLTNPTYYLYDASNNLVSTSNSGNFNNLDYGSYCVNVVNTCYDTTIRRCFSVAPLVADISVAATATCNIGFANLSVTFNSGLPNYTVQVYNPGGMLIQTVNSPNSPVAVNNLPALPAGMSYRVIGIDNCGSRDTINIQPNASWFTKSILADSKCPSGLWQNGSGDLQVSSSSSFGATNPKIIKKNGATFNVNPNSANGSNYTFSNMEPATYIVQYTIPTCPGNVNDTFALQPYSYPTLQQSAAYQCNNNSFSVGAAVTGGASPYNYEVIGSIPAAPSIVKPQQLNPVFNVSNGTSYSLVRLRAVDACGNATLNDVSILPLANTVVNASSNCFFASITLSVDPIPNATYQWYKKTSATDSVLIGSGGNFNIPYMLPSDTGTYVAKISVNGGCLTKISTFSLNGLCGGWALPVKVPLTAKPLGETVQLNWKDDASYGSKEFQLERSASLNGPFTPIGTVAGRRTTSIYLYVDNSPLSGTNYYRLKITDYSGKVTYTNITSVKMAKQSSISIFPNPTKDVVNINFNKSQTETYQLTLYTLSGQKLFDKMEKGAQQVSINLKKERINSGMYILQVRNQSGTEMEQFKIIVQ